MDSLRVTHNTIKTNTSQDIPPLGIGTIAAFNKYLIVNNLDQNIEVSTIEQSLLKPAARYIASIYPEGTEDAAFDLDIHTFLYSDTLKSILFLNHFGRITFFDSALLDADGSGQLKVLAEMKWLGDVEQTLLIENCLVSTSPGGYHVPEPSRPGLFVSKQLSFSTTEPFSPREPLSKALDYSVYFAEKGAVSAIAKFNDLLAVAFGQEIILLKVKQEKGSLSVNDIIQETSVNFHTRFLSFNGEQILVSAGHDIDCQEDTTDSNTLTGGGFATMDISNGKILSSIPFTQNLAWGNGGQCLTIANHLDNNVQLIGVDRHANLYKWHLQNESAQILAEPKSDDKNSSYGISHLAWQGMSLFCGFNRDGNRLHRYTFSTT